MFYTRSTIIIKLMGGLGNQLFQYAFVRGLSLEYNREFTLDTSWYKYEKKNPFNCSILNFNIIEKYPSPFITKYLDLIGKFHYLYAINKIFNRYLISKLLPRYVSERKFNAQNILKKDSMVLVGYWLKLEYFEKYEDIIRKEFTPKNKLTDENEGYLKKIESSNSISAHIRRGAYVSDPEIYNAYFHTSLDYYSKAFSYMARKVKNPVFFIFSNEIGWAKENLKIDYPAVFVDSDGPDFEHLFLMSRCRHNIITSSSFSWWGAWLNGNKSKIVIAPKKLSKTKSWEGIMPTTWLRFDN